MKIPFIEEGLRALKRLKGVHADPETVCDGCPWLNQCDTPLEKARAIVVARPIQFNVTLVFSANLYEGGGSGTLSGSVEMHEGGGTAVAAVVQYASWPADDPCTPDDPSSLILEMNTSLSPAFVPEYAPEVVGKSPEKEYPVIQLLPSASWTRSLGMSSSEPPRKVE